MNNSNTFIYFWDSSESRSFQHFPLFNGIEGLMKGKCFIQNAASHFEAFLNKICVTKQETQTKIDFNLLKLLLDLCGNKASVHIKNTHKQRLFYLFMNFQNLWL